MQEDQTVPPHPLKETTSLHPGDGTGRTSAREWGLVRTARALLLFNGVADIYKPSEDVCGHESKYLHLSMLGLRQSGILEDNANYIR